MDAFGRIFGSSCCIAISQSGCEHCISLYCTIASPASGTRNERTRRWWRRRIGFRIRRHGEAATSSPEDASDWLAGAPPTDHSVSLSIASTTARPMAYESSDTDNHCLTVPSNIQWSLAMQQDGLDGEEAHPTYISPTQPFPEQPMIAQTANLLPRHSRANHKRHFLLAFSQRLCPSSQA